MVIQAQTVEHVGDFQLWNPGTRRSQDIQILSLGVMDCQNWKGLRGPLIVQAEPPTSFALAVGPGLSYRCLFRH